MKSFSELGVTTKKSFVGNKIYIESILEKDIIIEFFDIRPSRKNDGTECLYMQIKIDAVDHVVFSSSKFLMDSLKQIQENDFPIKARIIKINRHYEFR